MLIPATSAQSTPPSVAPAAPEPARRPVAEAASAVVTVSPAGARAAALQTAKIATGIVQASADINHDGTVSDQEQQTDDAQLALKKALLEGGPDLDAALQAYQTIASLADAQR